MNRIDQFEIQKASSIHEGVEAYYGRERTSIIELIQAGPNRVFDVGCGMGVVGKRLLELGRATELIGAELFELAGLEAAKYYHHVHIGDVEAMKLEYERHFDYVLCGDVIEHLKDPYAMLLRIRTWLKPGGRLVCSLPNVRNWRVVKDLLFKGEWEYEDAGIMDRTHLRFFTRKSCTKLLKAFEFEVEYQKMLVYGPKKNLLNRATFHLIDEFLATQVLFIAKTSTRA